MVSLWLLLLPQLQGYGALLTDSGCRYGRLMWHSNLFFSCLEFGLGGKFNKVIVCGSLKGNGGEPSRAASVVIPPDFTITATAVIWEWTWRTLSHSHWVTLSCVVFWPSPTIIHTVRVVFKSYIFLNPYILWVFGVYQCKKIMPRVLLFFGYYQSAYSQPLFCKPAVFLMDNDSMSLLMCIFLFCDISIQISIALIN